MIKRILCILLVASILQGCALAVGAAAGLAVYTMVYDHRKISKVVDDEVTATKIVHALQKDSALKDTTHINVACFNQIVLLTGEAITPELKQQAEKVAQTVPNVNKIYNAISIEGPSSSLVRTSDSWISTKVKSQMLTAPGLKSSTIKVVTESGSVYLLGIVSHEQADIAVDVARQVSGVRRVVKIFQYR